jgi:hypothetical protein
MLVQVIKATYIEKFIIDLDIETIENNKIKKIHKQVDLESYLKGKKANGLFSELKDIAYFKKFKLNANTIEWENGVDIAPERFLEIK